MEADKSKNGTMATLQEVYFPSSRDDGWSFAHGQQLHVLQLTLLRLEVDIVYDLNIVIFK